MSDAKTILIVEDEKELREVLANFLQQNGFIVLQAENGAKGLSTALDREPDLILLDIKMPEMSGYEMLRKLRASGNWGAHVPTVILTNIQPSSESEKADVEAMEPAHYFVKSDTDLEEFVTKIRSILGITV